MCHSIRSMFRVLGIYNFAIRAKCQWSDEKRGFLGKPCKPSLLSKCQINREISSNFVTFLENLKCTTKRKEEALVWGSDTHKQHSGINDQKSVSYRYPKIQQTKMLVTRQRFLFGLVWQCVCVSVYFYRFFRIVRSYDLSVQHQYYKVLKESRLEGIERE